MAGIKGVSCENISIFAGKGFDPIDGEGTYIAVQALD